MRDERPAARPRGRLGWLALCGGALLAPACARAEGLTASAQVQYQNLEQRMTVLGSDGVTRSVVLSRETWLQAYEATQTNRFTDRLSFFGQVRLNDIRSPGHPDRSRSPFGTMRLIHPWFGLLGSYTPTTTTGSFSPGGFGTPSAGAPSATITTRTRETMLGGYVAPRYLPRLDVSWTRRHRDADVLGRAEDGTNRRANLTYDVGALLLHGGYNDIKSRSATQASGLLQRSVDGGGSLHLNPLRSLGLQMEYDYAQTGRTRLDRTRNHSATFNGDLRRSKTSSVNLFYAFRRSVSPLAVLGGVQNDHEGSLMYNRQLNRLAKFSAGGGLRTDRSVEQTGSQLLRYATAVVSADGDLRRGWRGQASFAHSSNWLPGHAPYSVETYRVGTHMKLRPGLEVEGDYSVGANTDTLVRQLRAVRQGSLGLRAVPVRSLTVIASAHTYQAGPGAFRTGANARSSSLDLHWRPVVGFEFTTTLTQSGALPHNDPRATTQLYGLNWSMGRTVQLWSTYSRSSQSRRDVSSISQLSGRDVLTVRLLANLGRTWNLSAGYNVADRGRPDQSRQIDAAVTKSFGR